MSLALLDQVFNLPDAALQPSEKALLVYLAHRAHNDGSSIYPGVQSMMQATGHKKWQTLNLLRKLKEKGYIIPVTRGGGPRNPTVYHIPLDELGRIAPKPIPTDILIAEKAARRRKKPEAAAAAPQPITGDVDQAQEFEPFEQAAAAAVDLATAPRFLPIPVTPQPVILAAAAVMAAASPVDLEQEAIFQEEKRLRTVLESRQNNLNKFPPGGRSWNHMNRLIQQAQAAYDDFINQFFEPPLPPQGVCSGGQKGYCV